MPTKSWRDVLPIHPAANLFPLMSPDELRVLGEDIIVSGLTCPIVLWSDGKSPASLLDGRNRLDAIELATGSPAEVGPPSIAAGKDFLACDRVITLDRSVDPYAFVVSANIHRRHLNTEEREEVLFKLIARAPEKSDRQIAKEVGVDHKTIGRARAKGEDVGRIPHVETRIDSKNRQQPAKRGWTSERWASHRAKKSGRKTEVTTSHHQDIGSDRIEETKAARKPDGEGDGECLGNLLRAWDRASHGARVGLVAADGLDFPAWMRRTAS